MKVAVGLLEMAKQPTSGMTIGSVMVLSETSSKARFTFLTPPRRLRIVGMPTETGT